MKNQKEIYEALLAGKTLYTKYAKGFKCMIFWLGKNGNIFAKEKGASNEAVEVKDFGNFINAELVHEYVPTYTLEQIEKALAASVPDAGQRQGVFKMYFCNQPFDLLTCLRAELEKLNV